MNGYSDDSDDAREICRVSARPNSDAPSNPGRRAAMWKFGRFFREMMIQGSDLATEFLDGKAKQEQGAAAEKVGAGAKLFAEACRTMAEASSEEQDAMTKYLDNLDKAASLPVDIRDEAIADVRARKPNLRDRQEQLLAILEGLTVRRHMRIGDVPADEPVAPVE